MTSHESLPRLAHQTEGIACWCHPDVFTPCVCEAGCALCEGTGRIRVARALAPVTRGPLLVVHNGEPTLIVQ